MKQDAAVSHTEEQALSERLLIDAIAAVCEFNSAIYVAGPLASGLEYYQRSAAGEANPQVRESNEALMRQVVRNLRGKNLTVIDPSTLKINGWSSTKIGEFYIEVLKLFAKEVRFMHGWQYSSGATKEFGYAIKFGKQTLDLEGNTISQEDASLLVREAAHNLDGLGIVGHKLHARHEFIANSRKDSSSISSNFEISR